MREVGFKQDVEGEQDSNNLRKGTMFTQAWQEQNEHMEKWRSIYGRSRRLWSKELRLGGLVLETRL